MGLVTAQLPDQTKAFLMGKPVLVTLAVLLLLWAIYLLWSVARETASAMGEYRASNKRSQKNDSIIVQFLDAHEKVLEELKSIRPALEANNEKLDRFESERRRSIEEIFQNNQAEIAAAARMAAGKIQDELMLRRDRSIQELELKHAVFEEGMGRQNQAFMERMLALIHEKGLGK